MEDRKRNLDDGKEAASAPRGTETAEGGWSPTFRFGDASRTPPRLVVCFAEQKRNKQIPPEPLFYSRTSSLLSMPNRGRRIRFLFFCGTNNSLVHGPSTTHVVEATAPRGCFANGGWKPPRLVKPPRPGDDAPEREAIMQAA